MNVSDLVYIDATGYHYPDYPTILAWVQDQYKSIYGSDIYLGADSMDGQWTAVLAQAIYDTASLGAANYASFSPASAQGTGLSKAVKINGLQRAKASYSTATVTIVGTSGTVITNGIAKDTLGQQWALPTTVTIPSSGSIDVTATAIDIGAINAAAGTIKTIFTPTLGWQSITNALAASPGAAVETDATLRVRQAYSTSLPALTVIEATIAALLNLTGVTAAKSYENTTNTTDANGLPAHSVCFIVEGGVLADITNVIGTYKTPGTDTYASGTNAQATTFTDSQGMAVPINFYNPAISATIGVQLTLKAENSSWNTAFEDPIKQAVATLITSFGIGGTILYTQIFVGAYNASTYNGVTPITGSYSVTSVLINKNGGAFAAANITLAFNEIPVCDPTTDIAITVA